MRKSINSATVFTAGNSSVGISSTSFEVELYIDEMASDEYVADIRQRLKEFYEDMTGDDCSVMFDTEIQARIEAKAEMDRQQLEYEKAAEAEARQFEDELYHKLS